ncbi:transporter [uncultured Psychroserpens sp.]|uniref:transporter n=1 Tax=uncultured Psychroserpens sp. TaxID=255436 RepID=UPI00260283E3|nr:transporter [uncultured Psychroserpens sp.]
MKTKSTNLLLALLIFSNVLIAQNEGANTVVASEPLITDRPDATESPQTIAPGFIQIETGGFYESFEDNSIKSETYTYNTTLVRLGLLDNLELRVGWDFVEGQTTINGNKLDDITSGFNPLLLGTKFKIVDENGWIPTIGFLGHLYLPFTASQDYRPETTGVDFRFSFAHSLNEKSSLSYNLGAQWRDDSPETAYIYTLSYGYSISDKLGAYVEVYGDFPEDSKANHLWDAGLTYLVSNNVQLDATVGSAITKGQDILISAGVSFRLPIKKQSK